MTPSSPVRSLRAADLWNDARTRRQALQAGVLAIVLTIVFVLWSNASANIARRGLEIGFGFVRHTANFAIGETVIPYAPADTYGWALLAGLANTIQVAVIGCLLTTVMGTVLGVMRSSPNPLLSRLVGIYVEVGRNIPLLLQLFFWYSLCTRLSGPRQALSPLPGIFLSNRGLRLPSLLANDGLALAAVGLAMAVGVILVLVRHAGHRQSVSGTRPKVMGWCLSALILLPLLLSWFAHDRPTVDWPRLQGFNFVGGSELSPEFVALLTGLTFYTTAFATEIIRGGIAGVSTGQSEAARALGLSKGRILRLVVLPQALRGIIPPLTSQYINLTKNSSLAVAIGFPDLFSISNTVINQTGQALEVILIFVLCYLSMNLSISLAMNRLNGVVAKRMG